ncbi:hypothetical protein C8R44DRAFT_795944 [Mycena epipterygia]|nr:hypothetical protein C8R44DRAFT_795944 [Mycena epipterygia]
MASDSEWSPLTAADTPTIDVTATTLTRHQTLLGTNEPPEGAELTFIRSVMSETGVRLTYLDDEITRLRERLRQLEEERTSLASYHAQNTAILSPVRRMPAELLEEIFLWTLPSTDDARYRRIFDAKSSPWVLTHICSRWREVALSTSSLWSLVVIHCNWMAANPLAMVKTQIQRARTLRIHFYGRERTTDSRPEIKMFRLLAEQSSRWTELRLELTSQLLPLLVSLRRRLPSLRRLWIQSVSTSQTSVGSIDCFQAAPCLVDATIRNYGHSHAHILLPAQHLTRYDLSGTWEMHRDILKLAQNLVEARIIIFDEPSGEVIDVPLQRLYTRTADVFDFIRAPALSEITIYVDGDDDHDLPHLDLLVARSGCTLRRLSFEGLPTAHIATHVLPKHPSITELAIVINEWARVLPTIIGDLCWVP